MKFVFVFPHRPLSTPAAAELASRHASLVKSFEAVLGAEIPIHVGNLADLRIDGQYVFIFDPSPADLVDALEPHARHELVSRLIPVDVIQSDALEEVLEPLGVPMAIDSRSVHQAEAQFSAGSTRTELYGPFVRTDVGERIGAQPFLRRSERYCYAKSDRFASLAHFVVAYLTEWERVMVAR